MKRFPLNLWIVLIGAILTVLHLRIPTSNKSGACIATTGIGLILAAVIFYDPEVRFPGYFALLPTLGAACLIFAGIGHKSPISRILALPPIVYIGRISYSLYLVHWPINVFAVLLLKEDYLLSWRLAMFALSICIAAMIYHLVENPFRHRRVFATGKGLIFGYLTGLVITLAIFITVKQADGFPQRFPDDVVRMASYTNDKTPLLTECQFRGKANLVEQDFCQLGVSGVEPKWLIYGDSHAWAAYSVFNEWLTERNQSGLFIFQHSCPPVIGVHLFRDKGNCFRFNKGVAEFLKKRPDLENLFLVSIWRQAIGARLTSSSDTLFTRQESVKLFEEKFVSTIEFYSGLGKKVFIWEPVPGAKRKVPLSLARDALTGKSSEIRFRREAYLADYDFFFRALKKVSHLIELSFSPSKALCGDGYCDVVVEGRPVYFDTNHITKSMAKFWVDQLSSQYAK